MSISTPARPSRTRSELEASLLIAGLYVFAAYHLALAVFMAAWPHAFFESVGPFGVANDHYVRDVATYVAALGVGLLLAVRHQSWRLPLLTVTLIQFALHSVNHLLDISHAHPRWTGYFDFFSLAASTLLLAWLVRLAAAQQPPRTSYANGKGGAA